MVNHQSHETSALYHASYTLVSCKLVTSGKSLFFHTMADLPCVGTMNWRYCQSWSVFDNELCFPFIENRINLYKN